MHKQTKLTSIRVLSLGGVWAILAAVLLLGTAPLPTHADHGPFVIDGDLSDWGERYRLDLGPVNGVSGYALYATYDHDTANYLFALRAPAAVGSATTLWLNTDQNPATGYQVFGFAGGAEFNINLFGDGQPYLYTGADGQTFVFGPLSHAYSGGNTILEMAVPAAQLGGINTDIDLIADVNNAVFLPSDYNNPPYTLLATPLPERTSFDKRVGIVYSQTTAENFWDEKSYAQLYASVQHQVMMAGIPFDLIHETALADYTNLINYDALIFPYYNSVDMDTTVSGDFAYLAQLETSLNRIVYNYGIGLIAAGDFMTNDRNDVAIAVATYRRHQNLLGLQLEASAGPVNYELRANTVSHPVMQAYTANELILPYAMQYYNVYEPFAGQAITSLAQLVDTTNSQTYDGMIATETGGRNIHFGTTQIMADRNLLWRAVQWVVYGDERVVELQLGRFESIFLSRNDMDQTQFIDEVPLVVGPLYNNYLVDWKNTYNFVGSYYINIGADLPPDDPNCFVGANPAVPRTYPGSLACTDWDLSRPLYLNYIALGNEVSSHSYTHLPGTLYFPANTLNSLTPAQRLFELRDSMAVIASGLSVPVVGAAQPGDPEALFVTEEIEAEGYMNYFSGGYSSVGAGFPSAFGYLSPDYTTVYLAPNMTFDFSLVVFQGMTPTQAEAYWQQEFHNLTTHGSQPIIHWPWHDYALTVELPTYSESMFTSLLNTAYTANTEFTTVADAAERMTAFRNASLTVSELSAGNEITATVDATNVGRSSLKLETGSEVIAHVDNWYAYNDDHIFLPDNGGTFRTQLGATADSVTHITHLPMRAELLSLVGNGTELTYTFNGEGAVVLELNIPPNSQLMHEGADSVSLVGNTFTMQFNANTAHTGRVYFTDLADVGLSKVVSPTTAVPSQLVTYTLTLSNTGNGAARDLVLTDTVPAELSVISVVGSGAVFTHTAVNPHTWAVSDLPAGQTAYLTITAQVSPTLAADTVLLNTAGVMSLNDITPANNFAQATLVVVIPRLRFSSASYNTAEIAGTVLITATLDRAASLPITVTVASADETATAGSDYTAVNQALSFAVGQTVRTFTVPITADAVVEGAEQFTLTLSAPQNAQLGTPNPATVIIADAPVPQVRFSTATYPTSETAGSVTITVTLDMAPIFPVTVTVASADETATAGSDYTAVNQALSFAAGQTVQTFAVPIALDGLVEGNEQFTLALSAPQSAQLGTPNPATVIIADLPVDLSGDGSAWHRLSTLYLGSEISADAAPTTAGDDGAERTLGQRWSPGDTPTITVTVSGTGSGVLVVWMDWDNSMAYDAPNERVISQTVMGGNSYPILLTIPAEYTTGQQLRVRARVYDASPASPSPLGYGGGGEVEDFLWNFTPTAVALRQIAVTTPTSRAMLWLGSMLLLGLVSLLVLRSSRPH